VVRLKGGDPLVFARGGEEAQALAQAGVDYDIVPGITAANACAASARIPLTHRGVTSGCTFITGHGKDADLEQDWHALARSHETLVVYMGLHALARIAARLMAFGRSPDTPVAVIERGGSAQQRVITAPLRSIAARTRVAGIASPALLVIGEVVNLREVLQGLAPTPEIPVSGPLAAA
jgi:uroporphyrin-III C-methyltransferase